MRYSKISFHILLMMLSLGAYAQKNIYALLNIDDVSIEPTFISKASLKVDNRELTLAYKVGRFEISEVDYSLLKTYPSNQRITLSYTYTTICPSQNFYNHSIEMEVNYLFQDYLILRVFNFENYPKVFIKNVGYGVEILSPIGSTVLPKRTKKIRRNPCLN